MYKFGATRGYLVGVGAGFEPATPHLVTRLRYTPPARRPPYNRCKHRYPRRPRHRQPCVIKAHATSDGRAAPDIVVRLAAGGLVAFPTETVNGLGADATSAGAVARRRSAKAPRSIRSSPTSPTWPRRRSPVDRAAERLAAAFGLAPLDFVLPSAPACCARPDGSEPARQWYRGPRGNAHPDIQGAWAAPEFRGPGQNAAASRSAARSKRASVCAAAMSVTWAMSGLNEGRPLASYRRAHPRRHWWHRRRARRRFRWERRRGRRPRARVPQCRAPPCRHWSRAPLSHGLPVARSSWIPVLAAPEGRGYKAAFWQAECSAVW